MFQGVCSDDGLRGFGGAPCTGLVHTTYSELVQSSFLQPEHWVMANLLNIHIAAHPLTLAKVTSEKDTRCEGEVSPENTVIKKKIVQEKQRTNPLCLNNTRCSLRGTVL